MMSKTYNYCKSKDDIYYKNLNRKKEEFNKYCQSIVIEGFKVTNRWQK